MGLMTEFNMIWHFRCNVEFKKKVFNKFILGGCLLYEEILMLQGCVICLLLAAGWAGAAYVRYQIDIYNLIFI